MVKLIITFILAFIFAFLLNDKVFSKNNSACYLFAQLGVNQIYVCPDPDYPSLEMYCLRE